MSERPSRRSLLKSAVAAGAVPGAAQHSHPAAKPSPASGGPKTLTAHEYRTLGALCELVIPGAKAGGAPEYIDLMCSGSRQMAALYTGSLAWIDAQMMKRAGKRFVESAVGEQTALLDQIAYRRNTTPELAPGVYFFEWLRKMTADAYYTSRVGIDELGFKGNGVRASFDVPAEAIEYALKRSP